MRKSLLVVGLLFAMVMPGRARAQVLVSTLVDVLVDGGNNYSWERLELPGTRCGDGSQYKFFVHRSTTGSRDLLFFLEGGGACWDYDTCSGRVGMLGAANPNGLADDYMERFTAKYVSPLVNGADPGLPFKERTELVTRDWNIVYLPYCTGDVHTGNSVALYADPTGQEPPLRWHHAGHANVLAAAQYAQTRFPRVQKLLVTGFSAGGTGSSAAYYFVRRAINPARGYLLNDSGPIHLSRQLQDRSRGLHERIRQAWALDSVFARLPASFQREDLGSINRMLATEFPQDQLAYTGYTRDVRYSRFSYERFLSPHDEASLLRYWKEDQDKLVAELKLYTNYSYFIPHQRDINASHCSTLITFVGAQACARMEKKRSLWEYAAEPWQSYKCYGESWSMADFLERFVKDGERVRVVEPANGFNAEDPGMRLLAPLINQALSG
ncbi:hypothetical protein [Archangium primigenium]|uniref:hypothetical protein n=1 Tax=[Archangium] primigenium TaxID=2792470 RepID=UPI0030845064